MAVVYESRPGEAEGTATDTLTSNSFSTVAGRLYTVWVPSGDDASISAPTFSGTSSTWDSVIEFTWNSDFNRISIARYLADDTGPIDVTVDFAAAVNGLVMFVDEWSGTAQGTNGADAIGDTSTGSANSTTPNVTLDALPAGALTYAVGHHSIWFENVTWDSPMSSAGVGGNGSLGTAWYARGEDNTPSCSFSGEAWGMVGVQILPAAEEAGQTVFLPARRRGH